MARDESPKEDLLKQATGLADRAEWRIPGWEDSVVAGFRDGKAFSLFVGEEPVFHWNTQSQLRRAYLEGRIFKAENGQLVSMRKKRHAGQVQMIRHQLSPTEQTKLLDELTAILARLKSTLSCGDFELIGQVTTGQPVRTMTLAWLERLPSPLEVADVPNVAGG